MLPGKYVVYVMHILNEYIFIVCVLIHMHRCTTRYICIHTRDRNAHIQHLHFLLAFNKAQALAAFTLALLLVAYSKIRRYYYSLTMLIHIHTYIANFLVEFLCYKQIY